MGTKLARKRGTAPNFSPMSVVPNSCMDQDATWYRGRPRPRPHCIKEHNKSPSFWPMSIVGKQSPISATAELLFQVNLDQPIPGTSGPPPLCVPEENIWGLVE